MPPDAITTLSVGFVPVFTAMWIKPPDCVKAPPLLIVILPVLKIVPPEKVTRLFVVIPTRLDVPPLWIKEPLAFTVNNPVTLKTPPVTTVILAPEPEELILTVVIFTVLFTMG